MSTTTVVRPEEKQATESDHRPKRQPRYNVVLWDDNSHTYGYVIRMLRELFGHTLDQSMQMAETVDSQGSVICLTTTKEHAELKQDQIHAYGKDDGIKDCLGSMSCSIEPIE